MNVTANTVASSTAPGTGHRTFPVRFRWREHRQTPPDEPDSSAKVSSTRPEGLTTGCDQRTSMSISQRRTTPLRWQYRTERPTVLAGPLTATCPALPWLLARGAAAAGATTGPAMTFGYIAAL